MALILYHKIEFLDTNPYGDYVAGDVVEIYYDDTNVPVFFPNESTSGIVVYKNGVVITSGADITFPTAAYKTERNYAPLICYTTANVTFARGNQAFPYGVVCAFADHASCANNGPVCDLVFTGTPTITAASNEGSDGAVTVTAASSNGSYQFKLGSDFAYNDGTAQSGGSFTGLSAGQYRIFARDAINCSANILITIPESDIAYNPVYRLEYDDPVGGVTRVDITKKNYSGSITEVKGANIGFERSLKGEGSQDKFECILATKAVVNLSSETNFAFSGLYTNNPDEYRLQYYKLTDAGSTASISVPALSTWTTGDTSSAKPNWTTGSTPTVTVPGNGFPIVYSENLYADYAFIEGRAYTITASFSMTINSGNQRPYGAFLSVTDTSGNVAFIQSKTASAGSNSLTLSFTANTLCQRIVFYFSSGSNVTITLNSVAGTIDGYATQGIYKVLPQQYSEEYKAAPYYVSIVATDGLPGLKDYVFLKDDGQRFHESMKSIELIAYILKKTKLNLNIRCAINLYATGMNTTDADDPLDQAYVDCDTYYINETEPTLDYVLRQILEPFGASIVQENAVWNIVRIEEKRAEYDYREFDADGRYVSNSSYDPRLSVSSVGSEGFHFSDRDHFMQLCPGYGKIRVFYKLGLRENILENGDFRLTSSYSSDLNQYFFNLDTRGFQLINAGYPITSTWEAADQVVNQRLFAAPEVSGDSSNVAWKIEGGTDTTGEAYIQSDTYNIKMGVSNGLKISVRFKVPEPRTFGLSAITIPIAYQKVKLRVKYGNYYLLGDGSWTTDENYIIIYVTEFGKYIEHEFTASQPATGAQEGYDFDVRLYHSYIFDAEFASYAALRGKVTHDGTDPVLPEGTKSEVSTPGAFENLYYYELEENTDTESEPTIIRPIDYDGTDNPVQWILKKRIVKTYFTNFSTPFWVDYIRIGFLTNGSAPVDTILRDINAEPNNTAILEKEVTHGSYQSLITTIPQWDFGVGKLMANTGATLSLITTNVLSANILYAGYFRNNTGDGWTTWTRDGISESSSLHAILLQQYAAQYKRSWRKLTGSFYSQSKYFTFLDVLKVVNDSNRLYLPISPTIDDKNNRVRGEFLELIDVTEAAGSDGSGNAPFSSGFTTGFGSGYN